MLKVRGKVRFFYRGKVMTEAKKEETRLFYVVANWKMNKTIREAEKYIEELKSLVEKEKTTLWIAVPYTAIRACRDKLPQKILVGAENMNDASSGAFTGEIAGVMLKEAGADFVLLGHSERRQYFHETNEFINKKVLRALSDGLIPVLCIGEGFEDREAHTTEAVVREQLEKCLAGVSKEQVEKCILAYEPIWAIGTGKTATPELVKETHASIRTILATLFSPEIALKMPILYGGSVSPATAGTLSKTEGVTGFLVGTASLDPKSFAKIAEASH